MYGPRVSEDERAHCSQMTRGQWWRPETYGRDTLTVAQVESGRLLLRELVRQGVRFVYAHRQSFIERGNDPGPEIWASVGQWAIDTLGMFDGGPGYVVGSGQPIPDEWRTTAASPTQS